MKILIFISFEQRNVVKKTTIAVAVFCSAWTMMRRSKRRNQTGLLLLFLLLLLVLSP